MKTERLDALFGMYSEAILAVENGAFVYFNDAALKLLPNIEKIKPSSIFPAAVLEAEADSFVGEIDIAGKRSTFSAAWFEGCRIFSVLCAPGGGEGLSPAAFHAMGLEMKNYLAVLKMAASIVLPYVENTGDERLGQYAAMINHTYYNILRLTLNMEVLGTKFGTETVLQKTGFNLAQVCRELVDACLYLVKSRGVELRFECAEDNMVIWADRDKIEQMLLNMISNSLASTSSGGSVTVSVVRSGESALIKVSDTGQGIPSDVKASVWNRYEQTRPLTDVKSGAGFGMAAVSQIARLHGGSVFFESRKDEGTTVAASIPIKKGGGLAVKDEVAEYHRSNGISPFLLGLSTVLEYDKFMQKYMD